MYCNEKKKIEYAFFIERDDITMERIQKQGIDGMSDVYNTSKCKFMIK